MQIETLILSDGREEAGDLQKKIPHSRLITLNDPIGYFKQGSNEQWYIGNQEIDISGVKNVFIATVHFNHVSHWLSISENLHEKFSVHMAFLLYLEENGVRFVNSINQLFLRNKLHILSKATECGFWVPDSILFSTRADIEKFLDTTDSVQKKWICKPVSLGYHVQRIDPQKIFTKENISLVDASPIFIQEEIIGEDVRVFCVNQKHVISLVHISHGENISRERDVDVRLTNFSIEECQIPQSVVKSTLDLANLLNLKFFAMDFKKSENGDYYFLECNFFPFWGLYDANCHGKISSAVIELLSGG